MSSSELMIASIFSCFLVGILLQVSAAPGRRREQLIGYLLSVVAVGIMVAITWLVWQLPFMPMVEPKLFYYLVLQFCLAWLCASQARRHNRNAAWWFLIGVLGGVFGVAGLLAETNDPDNTVGASEGGS